MKIKLLLITFFTFFYFTNAQNLIAVQNGNTPSFYEDANEAFDNAIEGDTLYFPGGSYSLNRTINKTLHIIGTGHNPTTTSTTGATIFGSVITNTPQLIYTTGGSGTVTGIAFTAAGNAAGNIRVDSDINGLLIDRVNLPTGFYCDQGIVKDLLLIRSIIFKFDIGERNGVLPSGIVSNNIIYHFQNNAANLLLENNVFAKNYSSTSIRLLTATNCSVVNNFLGFGMDTEILNGSSNNSFRNNHGLVIIGSQGSNFGSNNVNESGALGFANIFINYADASSVNLYDFDFHLVDGSPLLTASNSGGQIGIYGGRFPWKDGSIPFNPNIVSKNISGSTDENGSLPVEIEVEAQQN